jgi:hypothetical protein
MAHHDAPGSIGARACEGCGVGVHRLVLVRLPVACKSADALQDTGHDQSDPGGENAHSPAEPGAEVWSLAIN